MVDSNTATTLVIIALVLGIVSLLIILIGLIGGLNGSRRRPEMWPPTFFYEQAGDANFLESRPVSEDDDRYKTAKFIDTAELRRQIEETNPNKQVKS